MLQPLEDIVDIQQYDERAFHSYFGFPLVFKRDVGPEYIRGLRQRLAAASIESRPFLAGDFTIQPVAKKFEHEIPFDLKVAKRLQYNSLALPCHQGLTPPAIGKIVDELVKAIKAQHSV